MEFYNNNKKKLNFKHNGVGDERRQEWVDEIHANTGNLPVGVYIEDIDTSFVEMVKNDLSPIVPRLKHGEVVNEKMPVIFLTSERWAEFTKTWEMTNEMKDISLPFISVIRNPDVQVGTGQNGYYNIPGRQSWTYLKVPTTIDGRDGLDLYKIPQPTAIDILYEVKIFTSKIIDLNPALEKFLHEFNSIQKYLNVKGHAMPAKNEGITDESVTELEERKMFITSFEILVQGYILDENDFERVSTIERSVISVTESGGDTKQLMDTSHDPDDESDPIEIFCEDPIYTDCVIEDVNGEVLTQKQINKLFRDRDNDLNGLIDSNYLTLSNNIRVLREAIGYPKKILHVVESSDVVDNRFEYITTTNYTLKTTHVLPQVFVRGFRVSKGYEVEQDGPKVKIIIDNNQQEWPVEADDEVLMIFNTAEQ